jgi:hypothetical protein
MDTEHLRKLLIEVIEEEFAPRPIDLAPRWNGGTMILKPNNDTQSKEIPLETLFRKLTGIREALRVLEQKLNNHDKLDDAEKQTLQSYLTKCYGSLTTFNILFKDDKDKFRGAGGNEGGGSNTKKPNLSYKDAERQLGLNIKPSRY